MIAEIDKFLSLDPIRQQAFSLIQRSYPGLLPLDVVDDPETIKKAGKEIQRLEASAPDGFNKAIRALMTRQLPPLPSDKWPE